MTTFWIRQAEADDQAGIAELNRAAFAGDAESNLVERLAADGDSLASLIAHDDHQIVGHIQFFRIWVDGRDTAAGLGPMSVKPALQRRGIGSGLVGFGLRLMEGAGRPLVFVLGHEAYYPKFGFSASAAAPFDAPWSGRAFMARRFNGSGPVGGRLSYPAAFGQ